MRDQGIPAEEHHIRHHLKECDDAENQCDNLVRSVVSEKLTDFILCGDIHVNGQSQRR